MPTGLWRVESGTRAPRDSVSETFGVPVDDDRCEEIEPGDPEVLTPGRPIADLSLAADPQGILESMVRLALVQADLRPALHVTIEQPVDDEECPFNPSDFGFLCTKVHRVPRGIRQNAGFSSTFAGFSTPDADAVSGDRFQWEDCESIAEFFVGEILLGTRREC